MGSLPHIQPGTVGQWTDHLARRLLNTTDRAFRLVVADNRLAGLFRTTLLARLAAWALRRERLQRFVFRAVSQIGIHYRASSLSQTLPGLPAAAPQAGDRFPWLQLRLRAEVLQVKTVKGHLCLELAEHDGQGTLTARAAAWIGQAEVTTLSRRFAEGTGGEVLRAGLRVLLEVTVSYRPDKGLALRVCDLDPTFTVGEMAARVAVLIRGDGAKADLYSLNDYDLAYALCRMPLPVLVGIGHEQDRTLPDEVAQQRFATLSKMIAHIRDHIVHRTRQAAQD